MRRVVITGMGAITPIGLNVEEFWENVKKGKLDLVRFLILIRQISKRIWQRK